MKDAVLRLAEEWKRSGFGDGETVLIHSSAKRALARGREIDPSFSPADLLESFLAAVGPQGTILMPLFNFDFTKTKTFSVRETPSQMGVVTEAARLKDGAVRTGHPIYSFAVLGAGKEAFRGVMNRSGYGEDSPFGILRRQGGKIAVLDLPDQNSMTFYHHVEEMLKVPYRYFKEFSGNYEHADGRVTPETFRLFVRDIERGVETHVDPMGEILWAEGHYRGDRPGEGSGMRTIPATVLFDRTAEVIRSGRAEGLLFRHANP